MDIIWHVSTDFISGEIDCITYYTYTWPLSCRKICIKVEDRVNHRGTEFNKSSQP